MSQGNRTERRREYLQLLLEEQNSECRICGCIFETEHEATVDHNHIFTEAVRGALCDSCNRGLGQFKDSPESLASAIRYLSDVEFPARIAAKASLLREERHLNSARQITARLHRDRARAREVERGRLREAGGA